MIVNAALPTNKEPVLDLPPVASETVNDVVAAGVVPLVVIVSVEVGFGASCVPVSVVGLNTPDAPEGNPVTLKVDGPTLPLPDVYMVIV